MSAESQVIDGILGHLWTVNKVLDKLVNRLHSLEERLDKIEERLSEVERDPLHLDPRS